MEQTANNVIVTILLLVIVYGVIKLMVIHHKYGKLREQRERDYQRVQKEYEEKQSNEPDYILTHDPSLHEIQTIIAKHPNLREMGFQAILKCQNPYLVLMSTDTFPERCQEIYDHYIDLIFSKMSTESQMDWIRKNEALITGGRHKHLVELAQRQLEIETQRTQVKTKEARARRLQKLREAEAAGQDVCWDCETIEPERCPWGCCISGNSPCSSNYNGYCYLHDDD